MSPRELFRVGTIMLAAALGFCGVIYLYATIYDAAYGLNAVVAFVASVLLLLTIPTDKRQRKRARRRARSSAHPRRSSEAD